MVASPTRRRHAIRIYRELQGGSHAPGNPAIWTGTLLDALSSHLCTARSAINQGLSSGRAASLSRASLIIAGLYRTLDLQHASVTTRRLASIYRHLLARINRINRRNGDAVLEELIRLVGTIRSAWSPRSVGAENPPPAVHLAQGKLPAQVLAFDELDRRHARALRLFEVVDEQVIAYAHGRKRVSHPVGASDFSV